MCEKQVYEFEFNSKEDYRIKLKNLAEFFNNTLPNNMENYEKSMIVDIDPTISTFKGTQKYILTKIK